MGGAIAILSYTTHFLLSGHCLVFFVFDCFMNDYRIYELLRLLRMVL